MTVSSAAADLSPLSRCLSPQPRREVGYLLRVELSLRSRVRGCNGGFFMSLVVVSNRVAPTQANEPMTGGLASALLPVVRDSGAIWIGSSGRLRDDPYKESFAEIESLGAGAIATVDFP